MDAVRLDKWLWAARFYKTRTIAKTAIEAGHVRVEGDRSKVAKEVRVGMLIRVRQGQDEREVVVEALSDQRRGAPEAQLLYRETDDSIERGKAARLARKSESSATPDSRPNKRDRRLINRLKQRFLDDL
ncbi:RNA-binding S4 domain-containing protein [Polycyclovorans algicola]|uniref:RNA-binding S4 domain-containing protein n=1 Tax=Polycyclovorans algicola TaxID=616992 RepID=UPI0004A6D773|nr:S4 domain-containing protein [Polycyclovorans algicola]